MTFLSKGDEAPFFECENQNGDVVKLSDFTGKKLALYFYPKDSTPGCTVQACDLRDNISLLAKHNYSILGVSADSKKRHLNFIAKQELNFDLLADTEKEVITAYGVWGPKKFMGKVYDGIHRTTFLIDEKGKIEDVILKVKTKEHTNQILNL